MNYLGDILRVSARPTFETVYLTCLPFLRQSLRWLGVAEHDLEDVMQDVLLAAYRGLDSFDPEWGARGDEPARNDGDRDPPVASDADALAQSPLRRWIFGIAWRQASHYRDRAHRRREIPAGAGASWPLQMIDPSPTSEQIVASDQRSRLVTRLLGKIEMDRRVVLIMYDLLEIPIAHIARELQLKETTVRNRLRLAREDFRLAVKRMNMEERRALHVAGFFPVSELSRGPDPQDLVRAARAIPEVPDDLRRRLWTELQRAIARCRLRGAGASTGGDRQEPSILA